MPRRRSDGAAMIPRGKSFFRVKACESPFLRGAEGATGPENMIRMGPLLEPSVLGS